MKHASRFPAGIQLQRPARLAASTDRAAIAAGEGCAVIAAAPKTLIVHDQEDVAVRTIRDNASSRTRIAGLHLRGDRIRDVRPFGGRARH